jgi:hypothetical protein
MLVLVPITIAVGVWGLLAIDREPLTAAERRPAGGPEITIERGDATLASTLDAEPGPSCAQAIRIVGDPGSRAAAAVAMDRACDLLESGDFPRARDGLVEWIESDGRLRIATFEMSGVDSSSRVEDGRIVMELNAKFQFDDAVVGTPAVIHQLELIADPAWPGDTVGASTELAAAASQRRACERLEFPEEPPRGCLDVEELLADADPIGALLDAGFRDDGAAG